MFNTRVLVKAILVIPLLFISLFLSAQELKGIAVYISDGDTFHFLSSAQEKIRVRIADIDCPEQLQPYGLEAKDFVLNEIKGKEIDINIISTDRNGRKIAIVYYEGKNLSEELIKKGFAWHYTKYSKDPFLTELEQLAKESKIGLWADPASIAPWEFRKRKRK
jgi:micrococcal nuclease